MRNALFTKGERELRKSFNGGEIRDSRVSLEIHRDYWRRRKTFRAREREDELSARDYPGKSLRFSVFIMLAANQTTYFRAITTSQVIMPLLSSSKLMKIKLSTTGSRQRRCPDTFRTFLETTQFVPRDLFSRKTIKDPKYARIMIDIILLIILCGTRV